MSTSAVNRPLRWFLLLWVGLVYTWGLLYAWGVTYTWKVLAVHVTDICQVKRCLGPTPMLPGPNPLLVTGFTLLMVLVGALLWVGLSDRVPRRFLWVYFVAQGLLVLAVGFVLPQVNVVLSLYLALSLAAIAMLRRGALAAVVASGYALLFLAASLLSVGGWPDWRALAASAARADDLLDWGALATTLWARTDYAALLLFVVGYLVLSVHQARAHAQLESAHAQLESAHAELRASAARIEELTLLAERQRLARELHDTLAQGVAGLIMQLEAASAHLAHGRTPMVQDILRQAMTGARTTLTEARGVIDDLRATATVEGLAGTALAGGDLAAGVADEITRFQSATGIPCQAELRAPGPLPPARREDALRAVREGLSNIARHARAGRAEVRLVAAESGRGELAVEIWDDGVGFTPAEAGAGGGHYGLVGLRERARLAGGSLEIQSAVGSGTLLRLRLPCRADEVTA